MAENGRMKLTATAGGAIVGAADQARPQSARALGMRPQSARPQSSTHRYVQETLSRLSEDSVRSRQRVCGDALAPEPLASPVGLAAEALPDWAGGSADFRSCQLDVGERGDPHTSHALLAVAKVISSWESEVRRTADTWNRHLGASVAAIAEHDERWGTLLGHVEALKTRVDQLDRGFQQRSARADAAEHHVDAQFKSMLEVNSRMEVMVEKTVDFTDTTRRSLDLVKEALVKKASADRDSVKRHVEDFAEHVLGRTEKGHAALAGHCEALQEQLRVLGKNDEHWRDTMDTWRRSSEEAKAEAARAQGLADQLLEKVRHLESSKTQVSERLEETQSSLNEASHALEEFRKEPATSVLRQIQQIEHRQNIRMNMHDGSVSILRVLEFLPVKPNNPPAAKFADIAGAAPVFADVAELMKLFNLPMSIEVKTPTGKSGSTEWWQKLVDSQAALVRAELARGGAPARLLHARGLAQPGAGRSSSVMLRFHQDVFPASHAANNAVVSPRSAPGRQAR